QLYMSAVQIMTGSGGWPMNVIALPDGRPFWGGTYFRKEQWMATLEQIADLFTKDHERILEYADNLENGIKSVSLVDFNSSQNEFTSDEITLAVKNWSPYFDNKFGGN